MSAQSSWMRCLDTCVRYLRSTRSVCGREFRRTVGRSAYNNIWNTAKGKVENVKAMRRNAFLNDTPVRRYDDKYIKPSERTHTPKSYGKVQMPRQRASDHDVRTDGTYDRYLRATENERPRSSVPDVLDDDRYDGSFDPRFNDRHYRTYRKPTASQRHDNDSPTKYEWMESDSDSANDANDANWHSWQMTPRQQEQLKEPVAEDYSQAEEYATQSMPQSTPTELNAENLFHQWQSRSEPDRSVRLPDASKPGTVYKFNKIEKQVSRKYVSSPRDEDAKQEEHKYAKKAYNKYAAKVRKDHEKQFWHRWDSCPDERRIYGNKVDDITAAQAADGTEYNDDDESGRTQQQTHGYRYSDNRKGLIQPPQNFSGAKRKYQTSSQQALTSVKSESALAPPRQGIQVRAKLKRKLTGMEKQFQKLWDFDRKDKRLMLQAYDVAYRRSPVYMKATPTKTESVTRLRECDSQRCLPCTLKCALKSKASPQRLPALPNRIVLEAEEENELAQQAESHTEVVQRSSQSRLVPPRIRMTTKAAQRRTVPRPSFSECYDLDTDEIQHTEYTGFGRPTMCDIWTKFTRNPIA